PWDHGSTGPFRGGKGGTYEGGHRVPFIAAWPGRIEAGRVSAVPISIVDLLPTVAGLAGASTDVPADVDGADIWPLLSGAARKVAERRVRCGQDGRIEAGRLGARKRRVTRQTAEGAEQVELFHLERDPEERHEVAALNPDVVERLRRFISEANR